MNIIKYHSDIKKLCTQTVHLKNPLYLFALGLEYILVFSIKISTRNIFQIIFRSNHKDKTLKTIILVMFLAGGVCRGNSVVKCYALYTHTCGDPQSCSASEKGQCRPPQQGAGVELALERSSSRATKASGLRRAGRCPRS